MKKSLFLISVFVLCFLLFSCTDSKDDRYISIPFTEVYDEYDNMLKDYKKYNSNYNDIFLDSFSDFNPTGYLISGRCECKNKADNIVSENKHFCPTLKDSLPGMYFDKEEYIEDVKHIYSYTLYLFPIIQIDDYEKIEYGSSLEYDQLYDKYFNRTYIAKDFFIYYENKIILSIHFSNYSDADVDNIIHNLINYLKLNY